MHPLYIVATVLAARAPLPQSVAWDLSHGAWRLESPAHRNSYIFRVDHRGLPAHGFSPVRPAARLGIGSAVSRRAANLICVSYEKAQVRAISRESVRGRPGLGHTLKRPSAGCPMRPASLRASPCSV